MAEIRLNLSTHLRVPSNGEDFVECPSCKEKIRNFEVEKHCRQEMERLEKEQQKTVIQLRLETTKDNTDERPRPWSVFQKVQRNRQLRSKQRLRKRSAQTLEHPCPLCCNIYSQDEIQHHVEDCLNRSSNSRDEISSNDEEESEEYEEYEWAGQKRIRVSSLLQGGYAAIGIGQTIVNNSEADDEEEDLNVDEDDTQIFGPAQYGESDVLSASVETNISTDDNDVSVYMRRLITGSTTNFSNQSSIVNLKEKKNVDRLECVNDYNTSTLLSVNAKESTTSSTNLNNSAYYLNIIDSLKSKLRQYENQIQNKFKCLICLDDYRNPTISVACWHAHCEICWLRSLGARKLCPQCNVITTPKDLRRIYM